MLVLEWAYQYFIVHEKFPALILYVLSVPRTNASMLYKQSVSHP